MDIALRVVHVYVESERDIAYVVPVGQPESGLWVESLPVETCELVKGGANIVQQLGAAIGRAAQISKQLTGREKGDRWDGNGEVLWQRNKLFVSITWYVDGISVVRKKRVPLDDYPLPGWDDDSDEWLSADVPAEIIAGTVLQYLK